MTVSPKRLEVRERQRTLSRAALGHLEAAGSLLGLKRPSQIRARYLQTIEAATTSDPAVRQEWCAARALWWQLAQTEARLARRAGLERSFGYDDFHQSAWLGLYHAAQRFDPDRGVAFSTHAAWWVRAAVSSALEDNRVVHLSSYAAWVGMQAAQARSQLQASGQSISDDAVAALIRGGTADMVRATTNAMSPSQSLDAPVGDGETMWIDLLADAQRDLDQELDQEHMERRLRAAIDGLAPREREALEGWLGNDTQRQVGERMGLSRERVRQLLTLAIERLRVALGAR